MTAYELGVGIHLLAAIVWLGGMAFFALVGAPELRRIPDPRTRAELFERLGVRFRTVGWIAVGVLLGSGTALLGLRGLLSERGIGSPSFWAGGFGRQLGLKLALVAIMIAVQATHDLWLGPRASAADPGSLEAARWRRAAAWAARANAVVAVGLVLVAAGLGR